MAFGGGGVLADNGAAAMEAAAGGGGPADLAAGGGGPADLIQLSCQISPDGLATVTVRGDLDLATAERTVRYFVSVIDGHDGPVSADLSELTFCDACGLGALIRVSAYAEQTGRKVEMTRPSRAAARIMRLTGVDDWLLGPTLAHAGGPANRRT
jgi:anti-anti-sigma factor